MLAQRVESSIKRLCIPAENVSVRHRRQQKRFSIRGEPVAATAFRTPAKPEQHLKDASPSPTGL